MKIIYVADHPGHFTEAISEYEKRLKNTIEFVKIRPVKHADREYVIREETKRVVEALAKFKGKVYFLDELGETATTLGFAARVRKDLDTGESPIFLIGGSFGLDRQVLQGMVQVTFSLSELTFPHSLAYLVLIEQLYRIHEIWKGSKYHHI